MMNVYFELVGMDPKLTEYPGSVSDGTVHLPHAQTRHWKAGATVIQEEILYSLVATVYCYDVQISEATQVNFHIKEPFIQLYHMIEIKGKGKLCQQSTAQVLPLLHARGVYLYTPADRYTVHLESGHYLIYGFCFDPAIPFGTETDRPEFIRPLLDAYQQQLPHLVASIDFKAEHNTRDKHLDLYNLLLQGKVYKAICILRGLQGLLDLSIQNMKQVYERHHPNRIMVDRAREMIVKHFDTEEVDVTFTEIGKKLQITGNYLNKLHIRHYGISFSAYKQDIRLKKAKNLLENNKILFVALACGFKDQGSFCRFFKRATGYTANTYQKQLYKKSS